MVINAGEYFLLEESSIKIWRNKSYKTKQKFDVKYQNTDTVSALVEKE